MFTKTTEGTTPPSALSGAAVVLEKGVSYILFILGIFTAELKNISRLAVEHIADGFQR